MDLNELIQKAEDEGKMLRSPYQDIWFTPEELRTANADGRFCWGAINFELRDPMEHTEQLEQAVESATQQLESWRNKMATPRPV